MKLRIKVVKSDESNRVTVTLEGPGTFEEYLDLHQRMYAGDEVSLAPPRAPVPLPLLLWCPECGARHVDAGAWATRPHKVHACQSCGHQWRPALVYTVGVQFLPGTKDGDA